MCWVRGEWTNEVNREEFVLDDQRSLVKVDDQPHGEIENKLWS